MDIFGGAATSSSFLASVASAAQTTTVNMWAVAALAVAIPLAFYVIHAVIGLFPKSRARRQ